MTSIGYDGFMDML